MDVNTKYELVRFLYMEKMKGTGLTKFHFTPGEKFATTPTIDIVNELMNIKSLRFNDSDYCVHNPPKTGRVKTKLGEIK